VSTLVVAVLVICGMLTYIVMALLCFHNWGFRKGCEQGYAQGRKDEANWWMGAEKEADQVLQKFLNDEAKKARWWP
jgi:hypothetical protein